MVPGVAPHRSVANLRAHALAAKGFMPPDEGDALYGAAVAAAWPSGTRWSRSARTAVGRRCGSAPRPGGGTVMFAVDHHRGSEENQAGWEHHDPSVVDPRTGEMDTLPIFRATIHDAGLEDVVVAVVGQSPTIAAYWRRRCRSCSSTAAMARSQPGSTSRAGRGTSPSAARWRSTTCSPTRPTVVGRRTSRSTCRRCDSGSLRGDRRTGSLRLLRRIR